jgi:hypothetical protein
MRPAVLLVAVAAAIGLRACFADATMLGPSSPISAPPSGQYHAASRGRFVVSPADPRVQAHRGQRPRERQSGTGKEAFAAGAPASIVVLPNTSNTVQFTATVSQQCDIVALPNAVQFTINNHMGTTDSPSQTVTVSNILLANGSRLQISLQANAASFTPPVDGTSTWAGSAVSWNAASWSNGTGASGTLSSTTANPLVRYAANAGSLSATDLTFTLAGNDAIDRAGSYTLVATWKIESF